MGSSHIARQLTFHLRYSSRRYLERRTWRQRLSQTRHSWDLVLPSLVMLYLGWKYAPPTQPHSPMAVDIPPSTPHTDNTPSEDSTFTLELIDIYTLTTTVRIAYSSDETPIQALVKSGYLGNTPTTPSLAISLRTLELFRRVRLRKSSLSVEAFAKVICDLYSVRHQPRPLYAT